MADDKYIVDIDTTDEFLDGDEIVYTDGTTLAERTAGHFNIAAYDNGDWPKATLDLASDNAEDLRTEIEGTPAPTPCSRQRPRVAECGNCDRRTSRARPGTAPPAAGVIGFVGNEIAAQVRLRAGRKLQSPALVADENHARVDGFVSLGVLASAAVVALGLKLAEPVIGLLIMAVILDITWESWRTISITDPGEMLDDHAH
jgi:hypothetical protein